MKMTAPPAVPNQPGSMPRQGSPVPTAQAEVPASHPSLRRYALLSIVAAALTIALLFGAYLVTGSVGLFSAAAESLTNLLAAFAALIALTVAERPPDEEHGFGHTKAEYFSSGFESVLILLAAVGIAWEAWGRLSHPTPLENVGIGLGVSVVAAALNGAVAVVLMRAGTAQRSITLRTDGQHLLTDVWTTLGVIVGILLVSLTGWLILDPLIALLVAANIVRIAVGILNETAHGLLDTALPPEDQTRLDAVLASYKDQGILFHALRTRVAGARRFVSLHMLVPGAWTVQRAHALSERVEASIRDALPQSTVMTHVEPQEDPVSWADQGLDRPDDPDEA